LSCPEDVVRDSKPISWRIAPDPERLGSEWWDHARASKDAPAAILPLLNPMPPDEIVVNENEALMVRRWASGLPGWQISSSPNATLIL
jgi:hypothetical protein